MQGPGVLIVLPPPPPLPGLYAPHCSACPVMQAAPFMLPQLRQLVETGDYQPAPVPVPLGTHGSWHDVPQGEKRARCRVIMTAEQTVPELVRLCTVIKVGRGTKQGSFMAGSDVLDAALWQSKHIYIYIYACEVLLVQTH